MRFDHPSLPRGASALLLALTACSGTSTSTTSSQATTALTSAQCTYLAGRAAADACEQAFRTCVGQAGADLSACRATLEACLPPPPDGGLGGHAGPFGDADGRGPGRGPGPGPGHDGPGCAEADGGMGPRGEGHGGPGGFGAVQPDVAALTACHDALATCLAATPTDTTCFSTERSCERAAFAAAFADACQSLLPCASTDPSCTELTERCQEGVDGRPGAFDGGTCP